ncbi:hypothetical protein OX284_000865 [Flavobacterium sp. SUN046]|uniref:hypothetical protein n=1 Tax=Flavobacterium sp. SUN046 TaxID=3002440 RepID=UPI002DBA69D6|nr:hypothetical protein [Flavobacterium sp. SUN046]MEC4047964.1 hypothetical protein [Flavobacterium sp. SUN046]
MNFIESLNYKNEPLFYFGLFCLFLSFIFLFLYKTSTNQVAGVNAWNKPLKFAWSIMTYSWTMAWYCYYLPSFNICFFNWAVIVLLGFEIIYIAIQAWRGQLSHFNRSSKLYVALFQMMGLAASLVSLYTAYISFLFFQNNVSELPSAYLWSIRLGLILFVIFSFEGALMGGRLAHTVGGQDGSKGLPMVNWSTKFGDLRVAHFIGMHALQILPLTAYYVLKNNNAIFVFSTLYGLLALYTLIQALSGKPFIKK